MQRFIARPLRQRGLSLIELMVALLLSSFLIIGVTQIFITNKQNYTFQQNQIGNQENSRFSITVLQQWLSRAGYRSQPENYVMEEAFPAIGAINGCPSFGAGQVIAKSTSSSSTTVCIRYQRGLESNERNCEGNSISINSSPVNILTKLSFLKTAETINCSAQLESDNSTRDGVSLVGGLLDVSIPNVPSKGDNQQSVTVNLLFASTGKPAQGLSNTVIDGWNALTGANVSLSAGDNRIFQITQSTIALRNSMQ